MSANGVETHTAGIKFGFLSDIKDKAEHPNKKETIISNTALFCEDKVDG